MRKYISLGRFKIAVGSEKGTYYIIPTISISPSQVEWLDNKQRWDSKNYVSTIYLEWICFYIEFSIKRKRRRK